MEEGHRTMKRGGGGGRFDGRNDVVFMVTPSSPVGKSSNEREVVVYKVCDLTLCAMIFPGCA
jgi:hypothetical protein